MISRFPLTGAIMLALFALASLAVEARLVVGPSSVEGVATNATSATNTALINPPLLPPGKVTPLDPPTEKAVVVPPSCINTGREDLACFNAYYNDLVATAGVAPAFFDLKARYETSASVKSQCHQITHAIGHAAANLASGVGEAFALGDAMCWSGYYHGVMEEVILGMDEATLPKKMDSICSDILGKASYSFSYYNCVHGLGHGVMELYNDELFRSLDTCSGLTGAWERSSCAGGVFMENIMIESRGAQSKYLKKENPLYPCDASPEEYKTPCYLMQTSHMLVASGDDFAKVFALCATVPDPHKATCYQSLGRDASGRSVSDAKRTKDTCMLGADQFAKENCVIGASKDFVSYFHSDAQANEFCRTLPPELANVCLNTVLYYYKTF